MKPRVVAFYARVSYAVGLGLSLCNTLGEVWSHTIVASSNTFRVNVQTRAALGFRPISLTSANSSISAVWLRDYEAAEMQLHVPWDTLQSNSAAMDARGYHPVTVAIYGQVPDETYIIGYRKNGPYSSLFARLNSAELTALTSASPGSRVAWVQSSGLGESARYAGVLTKDGRSGKLEQGLEEASLRSAISSYSEAGYRPVCVLGIVGTTGTVYTANWVEEMKRWTNRFNLSAAELNGYVLSLGSQNLRADGITQYLAEDQQSLRFGVVAVEDLPVWTLTGSTAPGLQGLDQVMINTMKTANCTRASLAVSKDGRLVLSRGYTFHFASMPATEPTNLFRVASLSKTITAVTVMGLVEAGKLQLEDKLGKFMDLSGVSDPRWTNITVRHLLQHRGGWNRSTAFDPLFYDVNISTALRVPLPITKEHIVTFMLGQPLQAAPGTTYAYSNFGYLLLGRIIEKVTGQDYESFVRENVLAPLGIHSARLGRNEWADRMPGEVEYEEGNSTYPSVLSSNRPQVAAGYGRYNFENLDSAGMWAFNAEDLARYCSIFTQKTNCALLFSETIDAMWAWPPEQPAPLVGTYNYYGCGWVVQGRDRGPPVYVLHDGSLPGTRTLLVRQGNGYSWVALFNTRNDGGVNPVTAMDGGLSIINAISNVTQWPGNDLFDIDGDNLPDSYELGHFDSLAATDGTADHDNDGVSDFEEWIALSSPTDAASVPWLNIAGAGSSSPVLEIEGRGGRAYSVHSASDAVNSWGMSAVLARFNGYGFKRSLPVISIGPSEFYRTSVALRASTITQAASGMSAQSEEPRQIMPWLGIPEDLVPRDDL